MRNLDSIQGPETLSVREGFGSVRRCPSGCYHISFLNLSFRITRVQYRQLLEMLADAEDTTTSSQCTH